MADNSFKVKNGLNIQPIASAAPSAKGDVVYDSSTDTLQYYNGSARTVANLTESQTFTNKTLTSPAITTPSGIVKGDVGLGNVDNTSDATKNSASVTLTNKTIDAASNTISNISNTEIKSAAAIAVNKLAALTASRAVVSDGSGFVSAATTTSTEIGYVNGVTSAIQTQLDAKVAKSVVTAKGDLIAATASATVSNLAVGTNNYVLTADSSQSTGMKWAAVASTAPDSQVYVHTGNGYGAVNTKIRRYTTAAINNGSDITYADSANNGGSFTINTTGLYAITVGDSASAGAMQIGVTVNGTALTTNMNSVTYAQGKRIWANPLGQQSLAITLKLAATDVVMMQGDATGAVSTDSAFFSIVRVG